MIQDDSLGESAQIHFTQWQDASAKCDSPIKSLQGDVKWQFFAGSILKEYFQSGLTQKNVKKKIVIQLQSQFFKIVHVLLYVLNEWILFTVFCSMFSEPRCLVYVIFNALSISGHIVADVANYIG